jgi:acyl carrier protein
MEHTETLLTYITDNFTGGRGSTVNADTSLFQGQVLDSLNLVELITFVESQFRIKVAPSEVSIDNLDTVNRIAGFIQRKLADHA